MNQSTKLMKFEKKILDLVVCPKTKEPLIWNKKNELMYDEAYPTK